MNQWINGVMESAVDGWNDGMIQRLKRFVD